jgi:hypothetical protein
MIMDMDMDMETDININMKMSTSMNMNMNMSLSTCIEIETYTDLGMEMGMYMDTEADTVWTRIMICLFIDVFFVLHTVDIHIVSVCKEACAGGKIGPISRCFLLIKMNRGISPTTQLLRESEGEGRG